MVPTVVLQLVPVLLLSPPLNKKKLKMCHYASTIVCGTKNTGNSDRTFRQQWLLVKMLKDALRNYETYKKKKYKLPLSFLLSPHPHVKLKVIQQ